MLRGLPGLLYGSTPAEFVSAYGVSESVERLVAATKRSVFSSLGETSAVGTVTESAVKLQRVIPMMSNSFKPFFVGRFEVRDGVTVLTGRFTMSLFVKIFMTIWFGMLFLIGGAITLSGIKRQGSAPSLVVVQPLLMVGGGILVLAAGKWLSRNDVVWLSAVIGRALGKTLEGPGTLARDEAGVPTPLKVASLVVAVSGVLQLVARFLPRTGPNGRPGPGTGIAMPIIDLLEYEAEQATRVAVEDVHEVCNYLDAIKYARGQLRGARGLPISMRLLNEAHRRLMRGARGANKQPGEIRRSQNWIGGTRPGNAVFVPAPSEELPALLADLEKYLHTESGLPSLVRIGLAHVQFETIHPYLDGDGRIGRLLITLLLEHWALLSAPLLYLSLFFKRHRAEYYRLLGEVRRSGDWEAWMGFFLEGVETTADEAVTAAREIFALVTEDRQRLLVAPGASVMAVRLMDQLPTHPVVTIPAVVKLLKTTKPTAGKAVHLLENLGVLTETTGKQRDRTFAYAGYLEKLRVGTEIGI